MVIGTNEIQSVKWTGWGPYLVSTFMLTNGQRFEFDCGYISAFYDTNSAAEFNSRLRIRDFRGDAHVSREQALAKVRKVVALLENCPTAKQTCLSTEPKWSAPSAYFDPPVPRFFLDWSGKGIRVAAEVDTAADAIRFLLVEDTARRTPYFKE